MKLKELLNKRLIFISGKGGVGKTTVAVLLGLFARHQKKNTILVEMNSSGRIAPLFGTEAKTDHEVPVAPYLSTINITPPSCFEEYVLRHIRFRSIYEILFNNAFVMNFINATPGLAEILMLGKIYDLTIMQNHQNNESLYDTVIVDAPASGHGLSALEVPHIILEAVKIGPLHSTAQKMVGLFSNKSCTALSLVTLAEEMPVNETEELYLRLKGRIDIGLGPVFTNRIVMPPQKISTSTLKKIPDTLAVYRNYHELTEKRSRLNAHYVKILHERLPDANFITLPEQFHDISTQQDITPLLSSLKEAL